MSEYVPPRKSPAMGPPSDFGWAYCHGCEALQDDWGMIRHEPDCPDKCVRKECDWHEDLGR